MLALFLIAAIAGGALGFFFRAAVLAGASVALLIYAAIMLHGWDTPNAILICVCLLATMQIGYLAGLAASHLSRKAMRALALARNSLAPSRSLNGQNNYGGAAWPGRGRSKLPRYKA